MNKKHIRFSLITCALCLGFLSDAVAAPSVKRLGGMNTYTGTSDAVSAKSGNITKTNSGSRSSSVRTNRLTNTKGTVSTKTTASNAKANTSRLSVGQYLHSAGVNAGKIKPVSSGSSVTPSEVSDLTLRIENLENNKADKGDYYTKDEIDNKNYLTQTDVENTYVTKTEIQNNYYTTEQITNNYATKTEMNDMSDTVSNIDSRLTVVEQTAGSSAGTVDDWKTQGPSWANN